MNLNFLQFLQDGNNEFSSMRLIVLLWSVGILLMWMFCSFSNKCLQPLPESVIAVMGILVTGKAVQKKIEQPKQDCKE
jgi:hypothetical protein